MRSQDIQIPEPCHADWDAMRPEQRGRYCFECRKKVHDLSAMTRPQARDFLRDNASADICVSYQHGDDGVLVFRERPAPVVPLSRLRRPRGARTMAAAVASAGMAVALAACAPHGEPGPVHEAETPTFSTPAVVIPHGPSQTATPVPPSADEPCDGPTTEQTTPAEPLPRVRGRIRRPAGKPIAKPSLKKGKMVGVSGDPLDL